MNENIVTSIRFAGIGLGSDITLFKFFFGSPVIVDSPICVIVGTIAGC